MSRGTPQGRGVGTGDTDDIFDSIINSRAIQTGLIEDLEDNILFVDGFGKDKFSDMTTNIIRKHLIDYTIDQCNLHGIPLVANIPSEFYWSRGTTQWEQQPCDSLVIDICFDNAATEGIFFRFSNNMNLPCPYIMMECKNYSADPANPELDQLSGRFSPNRGRVGFLLCRTIDNMNRFIDRCRDTYRDNRGLIILLVGDDLIELLRNYNNWNSNFIDKFISDRVREIAIN